VALENDAPLARVLGQPKLFHRRADLVHVPAQEACGLCDRPAVVEFVLEVANIGFGPGSPEFASMGRLLIGEGLAQAKGSDFQKQDPRCIATPGVSSLWVSIGQGSDVVRPNAR